MQRLVEYSDSEPDEKDDESPKPLSPQTKKSKSALPERDNDRNSAPPPPPLPASFHDLYATNVRLANVDDPNLHGGRKRQTPHIEGNWPTHVYLEWYPTPEQTATLEQLISAAANAPNGRSNTSAEVHSLLESSLGAPLPLHISLSRTLQLEFSDRDTFPTAVELAFRSAGLNPFDVSFRDVAWFANYERNRWFLSLACQKPGRNELNRLLFACNRVCKQWRQPLLYYSKARTAAEAEPRANDHVEAPLDEVEMQDCSSAFHASLAYALRVPHKEKEPLLEWAGQGGSELQTNMAKLSVRFDTVKVKIGNRITSIELGKKGGEGKKRKRNGILC